MTSKRTWAARTAVLAMSATVLVGVSSGSASAAGSTCTPQGPHRPDGPITTLVEPLFGLPGYPSTPLGDTPFVVTGLLDTLICPLLP